MKDDSCLTLPLAGRQITQLRFDSSVELEFVEGNSQFSIRINVLFTLTSPTGSSEFNPEQTRQCGPVLQLFNSLVTSAKAFNSGRLEIIFSDGVLLKVNSDPQFEAWEAFGSDGMRVVAVPGGELAIWQPGSST